MYRITKDGTVEVTTAQEAFELQRLHEGAGEGRVITKDGEVGAGNFNSSNVHIKIPSTLRAVAKTIVHAGREGETFERLAKKHKRLMGPYHSWVARLEKFQHIPQSQVTFPVFVGTERRLVAGPVLVRAINSGK